jgi:ketosteroid isomerase-like protein
MNTLATEPEGIVASLLERFNSGNAAAMMTLYDPEAVFVADDGRTITDHSQIEAELGRFLSVGAPMTATARHIFVAGDIAAIVLDWSLDGTDLKGTASDIARRGADGRWRYLIDNPYGTAMR